MYVPRRPTNLISAFSIRLPPLIRAQIKSNRAGRRRRCILNVVVALTLGTPKASLTIARDLHPRKSRTSSSICSLFPSLNSSLFSHKFISIFYKVQHFIAPPYKPSLLIRYTFAPHLSVRCTT